MMKEVLQNPFEHDCSPNARYMYVLLLTYADEGDKIRMMAFMQNRHFSVEYKNNKIRTN